jgi:hypothetical protein
MNRHQRVRREPPSTIRRDPDCDLSLPDTPQKPVHKAYSGALDVLASIVASNRTESRDMVYVGQIIHDSARIKGYILGPTRVDGGIILLARTRGFSNTQYFAYFLDDLFNALESCRRCGQSTDLWKLILKAVAKRSQILRGTTNYFSGITGKVIKIL